MEERLNKITPYFITLLMIFTTDTFLTFANVNTLPRKILLLTCLFCGVCWLLNNRGQMDYINSYKFVILFFLIAFTIVTNSDYSGGNIIKAYILLLGFLFSQMISFDKMKQSFIDIMFVISLVSLICYALYPFFKRITFLPLISNGEKSLLCLGLTNVDLTPNNILRNWGPFWEPGVFQIYLNLSIIFLLLEEKRDYKKIIVNIAAIISTFSTTGYIALALIIFGFYLTNCKKITLNKAIAGLFCISGSLLIFLNESFTKLLFGKLNPKSAEFTSASSRIGSIVANWLCIKKGPIFGVGVNRLTEIVNEYIKTSGDSLFSNTNGLLMNYAIFGVVFGLFYTYLLIKFISNLTKKNKIIFVFVLLTIVLELFSEPLINSLLFNTIIFYSNDIYERCENENC